MPQKFLIIQTAFIGDVVLATSLIENLHAEFPDVEIDFLVRKGNEGLLKDHPLLRRVLIWDKKNGKLKNLFSLLLGIRKEKYDKVINVQRYTATGLLTAFSKAKERIGFDKNPLSRFFDVKVQHVFSDLHETERNHLLIKHLVKGPLLKPKLYPSATDEESVRNIIEGASSKDPATTVPPPKGNSNVSKFITISPASVWFTKQYPPNKWAAFINKLPHDIKVYLLGGKTDRSLCEAIIQMTESNSPVNLCGELNFLQSAALMKHARMNYVNDSAPMHFASAVNAPVTVVYCSTIPAFGYGPLSDIQFIIERTGPLYCRPCGLHGHRECPEGHFKCALEIDDEQLLSTAVAP